MLRVVLDTNVLVAGLRSRQGASFQVLKNVGRGGFEIALSVPLVLEYEEVLLRPEAVGLSEQQAEDLIDYFCGIAHLQEIFFLWRPLLPDPKDDLILELAVAANCSAVITHNVRDLGAAQQFGVSVLTPAQLLAELEGKR